MAGTLRVLRRPPHCRPGTRLRTDRTHRCRRPARPPHRARLRIIPISTLPTSASNVARSEPTTPRAPTRAHRPAPRRRRRDAPAGRGEHHERRARVRSRLPPHVPGAVNRSTRRTAPEGVSPRTRRTMSMKGDLEEVQRRQRARPVGIQLGRVAIAPVIRSTSASDSAPSRLPPRSNAASSGHQRS